MTFLAYAGKDDCTSLTCRRYLDPPGEPVTPGCIGWHCAVCNEPSSQYGHPSCQEKDSAEEQGTPSTLVDSAGTKE